MSNKICGECKYHNPISGICIKLGKKPSKTLPSCPYRPTNGDRIIAGGMRPLAKAMVYGYRETDENGQVMDGMLYTWHLHNAKVFTEYNEAVDYLEDWLNAPAESEVKDE